MGNILGLQTMHTNNGETTKPVNIIKVSARSRTAAVAGAISGAYNGLEAIPARWRDGVEAGGEIADLAARIFHIVGEPGAVE